MPIPLTIQGTLRIPRAFLQDLPMDAIERRLQAYGLVPIQATDRRWRLDHDAPGGYILTYTFVLPLPAEE